MRNALIGVAKSSSTGRIGSEKMNSYAPMNEEHAGDDCAHFRQCVRKARQVKSSQVM